MFESIDKQLEHASHRTAVGIKSNVSILKEPLLRSILSGESISEEEKGYLNAIEDVEKIIEGYIEDMKDPDDGQ